MLDLGWSEIAVIAVLALVVIGPKDLPRVLRTLGQWVRRIRSVGREFQHHLDDIMRDTGADELKREVNRVGRADLRRSVNETIDPGGQVARSLDSVTRPVGAATPPSAPSPVAGDRPPAGPAAAGADGPPPPG